MADQNANKIQGADDQNAANPVPVSIVSGGGTGGTASTFGAANPSTGTAAGYSDGTNMQEARVYDTDTGAGTENTLGVVLRKSASGGSVELGTSTAPVRTDPTGTTTQPVTGTITAVTAISNALPTGTNSIGGTKDNGPQWTSSFGVTSAAVASADMTTAANVTDAPTSGQKLVITDFIVSSDTAMRFDFQEETSATVVLSVYLAANSAIQITPRGRCKLATADKHLQGKASVAGNVRVTPYYFSES